MDPFLLMVMVIVVAVVFEYINGFHDAANAIATVVSTRVLTPRQAIMLAAVTNLFGAFWGTAVATSTWREGTSPSKACSSPSPAA